MAFCRWKLDQKLNIDFFSRGFMHGFGFQIDLNICTQSQFRTACWQNSTEAIFLSNCKVQFWISVIWQVFSFRSPYCKMKKVCRFFCQIIMGKPLNNNGRSVMFRCVSTGTSTFRHPACVWHAMKFLLQKTRESEFLHSLCGLGSSRWKDGFAWFRYKRRYHYVLDTLTLVCAFAWAVNT